MALRHSGGDAAKDAPNSLPKVVARIFTLCVRLGRAKYDLAIPTYGLNSGANWGTTQFGNHGPFFNQADDAARVHDAHLYDREWIENNYSPAPSGIIPSGPGGIANFLLGAIPFWLHNDNEKGDSTVTMTK